MMETGTRPWRTAWRGLLATMVAIAAGCTALPPPTAEPTFQVPTTTPVVLPPTGPVQTVTPGPSGTPLSTSTAAPTGPPPSDIGLALQKVREASAYGLRLEAAAGRTIDRYTRFVQTEPVPSRRIEFETQEGVTRVVIIGDRAWLARPGESFARVRLAVAEAQASVINVEAVLEPYLGHDAGATLRFVGRDARNGYETARYVSDRQLLRAVFPSAGEDASLTVWVSDEGYLIALEAFNVESPDRRVIFDAERIGDPTLVIDRPA